MQQTEILGMGIGVADDQVENCGIEEPEDVSRRTQFDTEREYIISSRAYMRIYSRPRNYEGFRRTIIL